MKKCWGIVLSVFALVLLSPNALAVKNVNSQSALQEAIDDNETEIIVTGNFSLSDSISIPVNTEVTIKSDESGPYTITKSTTGRFFSVEGNLTLEQITLDGNYDSSGSTNSSSGGVVVTTGGNFTMNSGAVITKCYNDDGGGVYLSGENSSFTMNSGSVIKNCTGYYGGGVDTAGDTNSKVMIDGGTIRGNTATSGGGIYINRPATLNMISGEISGNTASTGGGLFFYAGNSTISGGEISGNTAQDGGGITIFDGGTVTMTAGKISGNTASNSTTYGLGGGVLVLENSTFNIQGGLISDNTVSSDIYFGLGGGVCAHTTSKVTMNGGEIKGNNAQWGAGVCLYSHSSMDMTGGEISGNDAGDTDNHAGGGIYLDSSSKTDLTIRNNAVISGNKAYRGGAIFSSSNASTTIQGDISITNNIAANDGGGIYASGKLSIEKTQDGTPLFSKNKATEYGGAIRATDSSIDGAIITDNQAKYGGALALFGTSVIPTEEIFHNIKAAEISNNVAESEGGGIYANTIAITIQNTEIKKNIATSSGGGIYYRGGQLDISDTKISNNVAAKFYGGGLYLYRDGATTLNNSVISDNKAGTNGGGVYLVVVATLETTRTTSIRNNAATKEGGGIYSADHLLDVSGQYAETQKGYYKNLTIAKDTVFNANTANAAYDPPDDADQITNIGYKTTSILSKEPNKGYLHPLNNYDINYARTSAIALYTVTYDPNGGDGDSYPVTQKVGEPHTILSNDDINLGYTYLGYDLIGWDTNPKSTIPTYKDDAGVQIGENAQANEEIILYAVWKKPTYTITYHSNYEPDVTYKDQEVVGDYTILTYPSELPQREGYTFMGWATSENGNVVYASADCEKGEASFTVSQSIDLYAVWQEDKVDPEPTPTYTVTYDGNESTSGSMTDLNSPYTANTTVKILYNEFKRSGYTFKGFIIKDADGKVYASASDNIKDSLQSFTITSNVTLVAQWTKNSSGGGGSTTYTVNYNANGGTGSHSDSNLSSGVTYTVKTQPATGIAHDKYTFTGWNTKADGTGTSYAAADTFTISGNVILYAQWKAADDDSLLNREDHMAYVIGYTDGTVKPTANISRAETATIYFRLLTETARNSYWSTSNTYSDVSSENWFNNAVSTMSNANIITGYTDGTFGGNRNITRAEFAAIAARFDSSTYSGSDKFSDISGHWAAEYINRAAEKGWITGYGDGTFKPNQYITRAEAMTLINRVLGRDDIAGMHADMNTWSDNPSTAWYYEAVQEATNSHEYTRDSTTNAETWTKVTETPDWAALEKSWSTANSI